MADRCGSPEVIVRLFGVLREHAGADDVRVAIKEGDTVLDVLHAVLNRVPSLAGAIDPIDAGRSYAVAMDRTYVSPDTAVRAGSELAIVPPVSGG